MVKRPALKFPKVPWWGIALGVLLIAAAASSGEGGTRERGSEVAFRFADDRILESSGLAASAAHEGVVYTHNDSGGGPVVFAVGPDGETRATLTLRGAPDRDWEAIAPGRDRSGRPVIWVADIGDNIRAWDDVRIMRVREPAVLRDADVEYTVFRFRYEDGKSRDAEALLADPRTGRLFVVSKEDVGIAGVYRAPEKLKTEGTNLLRRVADAPGTVTDGAFTADGSYAVLRGYFTAKVLDRDWKVVGSMTPPAQMQGESVAAAGDDAMFFGSEGVGSAVWRVPLPREFGGTGRSPDPEDADRDDPVTSSADPGEGRAATDGLPGIDGRLVATLGGLGLIALILVLVVRRD